MRCPAENEPDTNRAKNDSYLFQTESKSKLFDSVVFFSHFQQLKGIEMETVDMLTKFMSTQRQAMTYTT